MNAMLIVEKAMQELVGMRSLCQLSKSERSIYNKLSRIWNYINNQV